MKGTQGLVKGWADKQKRLVLLEFKMSAGDKGQVITYPITCRNLKLTSEYLLEKGDDPKPSSGSSNEHKGLEEVLGDTEPGHLKVVTGWKNLVADSDDLAKVMHLKGRVATGLRALIDLLPEYSPKDFLGVNRKNDKGPVED